MRYDEDEYAAISSAAAGSGLTPTGYVAAAALLAAGDGPLHGDGMRSDDGHSP